jgi:predicted deacylase
MTNAFLGVPIVRGERTTRRVPLGELADGSPLLLPVATIGGARPGPTVYLQAGIHGDEMTGIEVCRQALATIVPAELAGNVVAVPVANVASHLTRTRGFLHEERWLIDINRIFPGNPAGLLTERVANVLFEAFVRHADLTIDLHSALDGCDIAPFVYIDPDDDEHGTLEVRERVGLAFGTPYVYYKSRNARFGTSDLSRSISAQADLAGLAVVSAEMGESRRVSGQYVPIGVHGVRNALVAMGMLHEAPAPVAEQRRFTTFQILHAGRGGGLRLAVDIGHEVVAGQSVGEIVDVFGERVEDLRSPSDGFILRAMRLGSIATGAEVIWVAS